MSKRYKIKRRLRYHLVRGTFDEPCWCGERHPFYSQVHHGCGGTGVIDCHCGGDFCCCHNHGEVDCFGCPDCESNDDDGYAEDDMTLEEQYNRTM